MVGHRSKECRTHIICLTCKGRHATVMCDPGYKARQNEVHSETTSNFAVQTQATKLASPGLASCQQDEGVHLQTFRSWFIGPNNASYVRGILDVGSQ